MAKAVVLILVPLLLRAAVWWELTSSPFFKVLFVDARIYHEMARQMASGSFVLTTPFWQPPFYPVFLSQLYRLTGPNPDAARVVGIILGTVTCVLTFLIARRFFGARAGWVAWAILTLSGPMIFFDLQLLNVTLGMTLALACLWLWSARSGSGSSLVRRDLLRQAGAGLCGGLAAITIGNMALLAPVIVGWSLFHRRRGIFSALAIGVFVLGALVPPVAVTLQNYRVSEEWIGVSYNSGINFWIGNNPEYDRTVAVRPGRQWIEWTDEPRKQGRIGFQDQSDYFIEKSRSWFRADPSGAARLQARKVGLFLRGDETMRNQEIYPFRGHSRLLRLLLWSHGLAFPFGLLLPLAGAAVVSLWLERNRFAPRWRLLVFLVLIYSISVVAFFVTSRFRLPVVPLLAILVGGGVTLWPERLVRGPWWKLAAPALVSLFLLLVGARNVPLAPSDFNSDAHYDLGVHLQALGDPDGARFRYEQALDRNPFNYEAMNNLAGLSLRTGNLDAAGRYLRGVLEAYPDDLRARYNLGLVYLDQGRPYDAGGQLHQVLLADPDHSRAGAKLVQAELMSRELESQREIADEQAVVATLLGAFRANPTNGFLHQRLRSLLLGLGREAEVAEVDRLFAEPGYQSTKR